MRQQPKKQCRRSCQLEENIYLLKLTDSIIMFLKELTKTFLMEAREENGIREENFNLYPRRAHRTIK